MEKEKQLIKKVGKLLVSSVGAITISFLILISSVTMYIFKVQEFQTDNGGGFITDIGALGVPQELVPIFNEVSSIFNVPNWVLAAVAKQESNFNINAQSPDGAYGIMQIQRLDILTGMDLWSNNIRGGLGEEYIKAGYNFSNAEDMWRIYLSDAKAQIMAGAYMIRYCANYVLYKKNIVENLNYNSNDNMQLIKWNATEGSSEYTEFEVILKRIFACYNGGPSYGMSVDLNNAQNNYPNKVFQYAMQFRDSGLIENTNELIEKAIEAGMKGVGKSPYVWGGGRTEEDVLAGRFDCSSFVHYMYASVGVQLGDRSSVVTFSLVNMGREITPSEMKRGDIIFFDTYTINGHVGVYLGNGKFIHDGTTRGVEIADINNPYWTETFNGRVRRVVE